MTIFQKLERKLGRYAIPDLMKYICVIYVVGFLIQMFNPLLYYYYLDLDPEAILHGHIWRIVTFLFYPPSTSVVWMIIATFVYYSLGTTLESLWGTFKYNFFFFTGALMLVVTALLFYIVTGISLQMYPTYMTFSIFLAYALSFPDATFMLYFIIPIKAKWLAIAEVVLYIFMFLTIPDIGTKVAIALSILNVALFFYLSNQRPKNRNVFHINDFR
ncbi:hypothetical protein [Oribacterium sp. WCC10]|uniref:hypothetical protein n=1 Tax=Oribacterium sp. WCC10 TaxID=1855343 RepID=UPI0008E5BD33|nr:hypothetical protein [Oribacterium sp. WCC10]SFG31309.1 hypothetical protein SAMN05216356_105140 [Oribacterium sp. WCC10]